MKIGSRVTTKQRPYKDGTVIEKDDTQVCVKWDNKSELKDWILKTDVRIMGFDPSYDSGVGVIRDGVAIWKKITI